MPVDRNLNIAIPVDTARFGEIWVHSTPISRLMFERYFLVLSRAFTMVFQIGGGVVAGPRIAALSLREAATQMGVWDGEAGVERGLMPEIHRLTNVVVPSEKGGWETMQLSDAKAAGVLDDEDFAEVEGAFVFFILASAMQPRKALTIVLGALGMSLGAQITSLNSTAFAASLPTSTATATSGATLQTSSVAL